MDLKLRMIVPLVAYLALGCFQSTPSETTVSRSRIEPPDSVATRSQPHSVETSYDTPHDREFADFVRNTAGSMLRKIAVGIERKGTMRVQVGEAVSPEDTLPLTKSLVSGAQKDFPNKPFTLSVFDPQGEAILRAHFQPGQGVRYEVAKSEPGNNRSSDSEASASGTSTPRGGTTTRDQRFADWAMETAPKYLRYVEADLDKRGRLWFGVTRAVAPGEVRELTNSLLKGARTEFPRRELTATVFDPDGERIGKATLLADGTVRWAQ